MGKPSNAGKFPSIVQYTCLAGYEATGGDSLRTCEQDLSWSGSSMTCTDRQSTCNGIEREAGPGTCICKVRHTGTPQWNGKAWSNPCQPTITPALACFSEGKFLCPTPGTNGTCVDSCAECMRFGLNPAGTDPTPPGLEADNTCNVNEPFIETVYVAQTHVLQPGDPFFNLVSNRSALLKVHVVAPAGDAPLVAAAVKVGDESLQLAMRVPTECCRDSLQIGLVAHSLEDAFTAIIPAEWIRPGMMLSVTTTPTSTNSTTMDPTTTTTTMVQGCIQSGAGMMYADHGSHGWAGMDMAGQGRTTESSNTFCQKRCARVSGCAHFTFWQDGGCHLQSRGAVLRQSPADMATSFGPPNCLLRRLVETTRSMPTHVEYTLKVGAPNFLPLRMFDVHYFGLGSKDRNYPNGWEVELASKLPVSSLPVERVRGLDFKELVVPARSGVGPTRCVSKEDYIRKTGLHKFDGEQGAALQWVYALQAAAGNEEVALYYINIHGVPAGGQGGDLRGVGHISSTGYLGHELGHALSLPHWGGRSEYPYHSDMYGIAAPPGGTHVGPTWAFDMPTMTFIPPTLQRARGHRRAGSFKLSPMQGGGSGDEELPFVFNHFSDYGVHRMQTWLEGKVSVHRACLDGGCDSGWFKWDAVQGAYTSRQPDKVQRPVETGVMLMSLMAATSLTDRDVNMIYPPIGPYTADLIRRFVATNVTDQVAARGTYCPWSGCDFSLRVMQGSNETVYMLAASGDASSDPRGWHSLTTRAVNVPARDGEIFRMELLLTPDVEQVGFPEQPEVLAIWEAPVGLQSGETFFVKVHTGRYIGINGTAVQARWNDHGTSQAIIIEKEGGGSINSGDTIFLKTSTGAHIDITGESQVQARWNDKGAWQSIIIEKTSGSGAIGEHDPICLKSQNTGKHVDVYGHDVFARWNHCAEWQTMTLEREQVGIRSGQTIFLKAHTGNHLEVDGSSVQARWNGHGLGQSIIIEKQDGESIRDGDTIFLKAHTGVYIDITGEKEVQARWNDRGAWQAITIEKRSGGGAIGENELVCLKSQNTGKHLDVEGRNVSARWNDCAGWQTMVIETAQPAVFISGAIVSGDLIHLAVPHTGNLIEIEGIIVQARWSERGLWQTLTIERKHGGGRVLFSGDTVFLRAHTGQLLDVQDVDVQAQWSDRRFSQEFVIERKDGPGAVLPGDSIFFRVHTGKRIDVQGDRVQARWLQQVDLQTLIIERQSLSRRLGVTHGINPVRPTGITLRSKSVIIMVSSCLAAMLWQTGRYMIEPRQFHKVEPV